MSKIKGNTKALESAASTDKTVMINMDLIEQLPDEYEAVVSEVPFNIQKDFADVGNKHLMPNPDLMYKIAEARGIHGADKSSVSPIYEDVLISEMYLSDQPQTIKMLVGYEVTKQSFVLEEDGTTRTSSLCTIPYNAWNRCSELWAKEESYTNGYTKDGKYPNKYDTKWKRKAHLQSEIKFAQQKAETKAFLKTVRELAGMMTGYKAEDLRSGKFLFVKIRRSDKVMKLETAARIENIRNGGEQKALPAVEALFGADDADNVWDDAPDVASAGIVIPEAEPEPPAPPADPLEMQMSKALQYYVDEDMGMEFFTDQQRTAVGNVIAFYADKANWKEGPVSEKAWKKAVQFLQSIESSVDQNLKFNHTIY